MTVDLIVSEQERGYSSPIRALHWLTAALLAGPYAAVLALGHASEAGANTLVMLHRSFGLSVLVVTVIRLGWRMVSRIPPLPADLAPVQRWAARGSVVALYGLMMLQPALGLIGTMLSGKPMTVFGAIPLPMLLSTNELLAERVFEAHGLVALTLLALVGLHVSAALYHHFIRRDEVLRGMLPWSQRRRAVSARISR